MMVLNFRDFYFDHVQSVLVYPDAYRAPSGNQNRLGVVDDHGSARLGEAWWRGPVILSWKHSLLGSQIAHSENLVCHEFAHQLDDLSGHTDGAPLMAEGQSLAEWERVMLDGFDRLVREVEAGRRTVIDPYGATGPEEYFVETQRVLRDDHFARTVRQWDDCQLE